MDKILRIYILKYLENKQDQIKHGLVNLMILATMKLLLYFFLIKIKLLGAPYIGIQTQ